MSQLENKAIWAINKKMNKASFLSRIEQLDNSNIIVWIATKNIINYVEKNSIPYFPREETNAIDKWSNDKAVDPITIDVKNNKVLFIDNLGHVFAANEYDQLSVPCLISKKSLINLGNIFKFSYNPIA